MEGDAAYRLISNDAVNAELIAEPHIACTDRRMATQPVALCILDISSLDFKGDEKGILEVTCLVAQEIDPPKGEKPVQWRPLTNSLINTLAEAGELIDWYRACWEIEMFFDILKNACKFEKLQLKTMPKLEVAIALCTVVAWRINRLIASLGGFLGRKGDGEPSVKTIWQGMERVASTSRSVVKGWSTGHLLPD